MPSSRRAWFFVLSLAGSFSMAPSWPARPAQAASPRDASTPSAAACADGDRRLAARDLDGANEKYLLARRLAAGSPKPLRARDLAAAELRLANVATIRGDRSAGRKHLDDARKSAEELLGEARVALAEVLDALATTDVLEGDLPAAERHLGEALRTIDDAVPPGDPRRALPRLALARFHAERGRSSEALTHARAATAIVEAAFGPADRRLLQGLLVQGRAEAASGAVAAADASFERAVRIATPLDARDPEANFVLGAAGMHFLSRGRYDRGVPLLEKAIALQEARGGGAHPSLVPLLAALANVHQSTGKTREAGALLDRAIQILERATGPDSPDLARFVGQRAGVSLDAGDLDGGRQAARRAGRHVAGRAGAEDAQVDALVGLARALRLGGKQEEARATLERALAVARGPALAGRSDQALRLQILGLSLLHLGEAQEARAVLEEALRAAARLGPTRAEVGLVLASLASALLMVEEPAAAEAALRRALVVQLANEGELGPSVGGTHKSLSRALLAQGDVEGARKAIRRAIEILAQAPDRSGLGLVLAEAHVELGALSPVDDAEREAEAARAIVVAKLGPESSQLSRVDLLLAGVAAGRGDVAGAEQHTLRALSRLEAERGASSPELVPALVALAGHATNRRDLRRAFDLLERADDLARRAPGDTRSWAVRLELVKTLSAIGRQDKAQKLATDLVAEMERRLGPEHPGLADALSMLGVLESLTSGDAEGHLRRARELRTKALGARPETLAPFRMMEGFSLARRGKTREGEALLAEAQRDYGTATAATKQLALIESARAILAADRGDAPGAVALIERAIEHSETDLGLALGRSTDRETDELVFAGMLAHRTAVAVHLGYAPKDVRAARAAVTGVLRMKERSRESASQAMASARRRMEPRDRELLDALAHARSEAAHLDAASVPPDGRAAHRERVADAWQRVFAMERELASRAKAPGELAVRVSLEQVRDALMPGSALIELVAYDAWRKGSPLGDDVGVRYAAYVVRPGAEPFGVDLGPVGDIDRDVSALRGALGGESGGAHVAIAARLYARLLRPLEAALQGVNHLVFAPDGSLSMLPFSALPDEGGHMLLERFGVSYVGSGRELAHLSPRPAARGGAVIVADPAFGERPAVADAAHPEQTRYLFDPLPGTAAEAKVLAGLLPGARVLTGDAATEAAVKGIAGPRILHVATHGFFLDEGGETRGTRGFKLAKAAATPASVASGQGPRSESAMTRSGLGFAGANLHAREGEDGVLSALEASGLDLAGTKLLVLSACQTGLGDAAVGHGVYGLRRAFAIAGAETQVLSLWKVSDDVTATLMGYFYKELVRGAGRAEALRSAQLTVAADPRTAHPYFWAAFVLSGDVTTLAGAAPAPPAPRLLGRVGPSARGCACDAAGSPQPGGAPLGFSGAALLCVAIARGRRPSICAAPTANPARRRGGGALR